MRYVPFLHENMASIAKKSVWVFFAVVVVFMGGGGWGGEGGILLALYHN